MTRCSEHTDCVFMTWHSLKTKLLKNNPKVSSNHLLTFKKQKRLINKVNNAVMATFSKHVCRPVPTSVIFACISVSLASQACVLKHYRLAYLMAE